MKKYQNKKIKYQNRKVYLLRTKQKYEEESNKVIFYLHGGAYIGKLNQWYWKFLKRLQNDIAATIIIPDYPVAPKGNYQDVFRMIEPLYLEAIQKVGSENLLLMGDSAGGGMALALAEKLGKEHKSVSQKVILISPWLDVRMQNPKIEEVQKWDKKLNKNQLKIAGLIYAGKEGIDSYLVNPILGPLEHLKEVTIFTGTCDILNPDVQQLKEKAGKKGITIQIKETIGAEHNWLINQKKVMYCEQGYQELLQEIKK